MTRRPLSCARPAWLLGAFVYTALSAAANAAALETAELDELRALATGEMSKLVVHDAPKPTLQAVFYDEAGAALTLGDFDGRVALVNFWATWCPPCLAEMPSIDRLAAAVTDAPVAVVAVSTDFGSLDRPRAFYERTGIESLGLYHDRDRSLAKAAELMGLPVTLLLDREGREVARLVGDAHWDSAEAEALLRALAEMTEPDDASGS